jgi:hypothetical protein
MSNYYRKTEGFKLAFKFACGLALPEVNELAMPAHTHMIMSTVSHIGGDFKDHPVVKYTPRKSPSPRSNASKFTFICL